MKIRTINHVGLPVKDRRVALKFYRDVLGLEVIPSMVDAERAEIASSTDEILTKSYFDFL